MTIPDYITKEVLASSKNKEYLGQYLSIITEALLANRRRYCKSDERYIYYEQHHILPKSLYPQYEKDKTNLVLLTAEEHFECHKLLTKVFPGQEMAHAFWRMCCCNGTKTIVTKEDYSLARSLAKQFPPFKGHSFSAETKKLIGEKSKQFWQAGGYVHTHEQDLKMVATRRQNGSYHTTPEQNKKRSESMKGMKFINNGSIQKRVREDDIEQFLMSGWQRGKLPLSEEHKRKIGESSKGRPSWNKGKPGTFLGKTHSDEAKRKMSETKQRKKDIVNVG